MSVLANSAVLGNRGIDTGDIANSLRFRRSAAASLSTGLTTAATSTYFCCFKQGALGAVNPIFDGNIKINANNTITAFGLTTTAVKRDPTSHHWLHVSNNGLVIDGVNLGAVTTSAITNLRIGYDGTNYADMYGSRMSCVSGTSLPYTDFVYLNTATNEWVVKSKGAIKALVDAGGAASFMYDFNNATSLTTLGYDYSAKGNNATLNNISLTAGVTYDHMLDVPGNSYCVLSPINKETGPTLAGGNLNASGTAGTPGNIRGTIPFPLAGKWSWRSTVGRDTSDGTGNPLIGIKLATETLASTTASGVIYTGTSTTWGLVREGVDVGNITINDGDEIEFAYDADAGDLWVKNITVSGALDPTVDSAFITDLPVAERVLHVRTRGVTNYVRINMGQREYVPPTGFLALSQANLPDIDPTSLLNPEDHHIDITVTKSGNTNFTLPWDASVYDTFFEIKRRDLAGDWYQVDGLRGYDKILKSNSTAAETTDALVLGVSGTTCTLKSTLADGTYVISATKAGLTASRQTNTDGTITSTVSRNVDSGFAIVTYTGTGAGGTSTIGHGLGAVTKLMEVKNRSQAYSWIVRQANLIAGYNLTLNSTNAQFDASLSNEGGIGSSPTTAIFQVFPGTTDDRNVNNLNDLYVAYCYADSAIQKSFSYTGNGSADGPYVNLGFECGRPVIKLTSAAGDWVVHDSARDPYNMCAYKLGLNSSNAENYAAVGNTTENTIDIDALGIKLRSSNGVTNTSGGTYIGHAWAATTGKYSNAR